MEPLKFGKAEIILDLEEIHVDHPIEYLDNELNLYKVGGLDFKCRWVMNHIYATTIFPFMKLEGEPSQSDLDTLKYIKANLTDSEIRMDFNEAGDISKFYNMKIIKNPGMVGHYYIVIVLKKGFASLLEASPSESVSTLSQEVLRLLYENGTVDRDVVKHYMHHLRNVTHSRR